MDAILRARQAAIARASEVTGGLDALSVRLGISRPTLRAMLDGRIGVPQRLFFELVDIISAEAPVRALKPGPRPLRR